MAETSRILVLGIGGTIAGLSDADVTDRYTAGQVHVGDLLERVRPSDLKAAITAEQLANVGSQDMTCGLWAELHDRIRAAFADDRADAVVVTHGTDTLEETAFLLDLVLPAGRPVVLVSAMRPVDAIGSDGLRNLACGFKVACAGSSRGRGVLAVLGDAVFAARDVYKAATRGTEAFRAFPGGPLGAVTPATLRYHRPADAASWRGRYRLPPGGVLPRVAVLYASADDDPAIARAVLDTGVAGVVLAGVGHGNASRGTLDVLARAAAAGVAVVRASRVNESTTVRDLEVEDSRYGFLTAGALHPQKARVLLRLLLANGVDGLAARQAAFDEI